MFIESELKVLRRIVLDLSVSCDSGPITPHREGITTLRIIHHTGIKTCFEMLKSYEHKKLYLSYKFPNL